jgi:hypothetical protein
MDPFLRNQSPLVEFQKCRKAVFEANDKNARETELLVIAENRDANMMERFLLTTVFVVA